MPALGDHRLHARACLRSRAEATAGKGCLRMKKPVAVSIFKKLNLTQRESEVLLWIARGQSNIEIAMSLGISPRTVKKHLEHIFIKLGVKTRLAAAVLAGAQYAEDLSRFSGNSVGRLGQHSISRL